MDVASACWAALALSLAFIFLIWREEYSFELLSYVPLLGDTLALAYGDPARYLFSRYKKYGSLFRMHLVGLPSYVIASPEAARAPYADDGAQAFFQIGSFKLLFGDYNVLGTKDVHVHFRKAMLQAVGSQGMQSLFPKVLEVMKAHFRQWEANGQMEVFRSARSLGLDLSIDAIVQPQLSDKVDRTWLKERVDTWLNGLFSFPYAIPGTALARAVKAKDQLVEIFMREFEQAHKDTKEKWSQSGGNMPAVLNQLTAESGSTIPNLLDIERVSIFGLDHTELRDTAMSVLHAILPAADTTRWALFNTWALVSMSPRVQDKLYEEQKQVVAELGPELSYNAVSNMPYMDATIKECMRLLPATTNGVRKLTADMRIGEEVVPAGSILWLHTTLVHSIDPALWDGDTSVDLPAHMDWRNNLEGAFRPERWLSEATKPKYYLTFGTGPHLCAGQNLAYMEIRTMLAMVLRKYRLQLETPNMLRRCQLFPFAIPPKGTDTMLLVEREKPVPCVI